MKRDDKPEFDWLPRLLDAAILIVSLIALLALIPILLDTGEEAPKVSQTKSKTSGAWAKCNTPNASFFCGKSGDVIL